MRDGESAQHTPEGRRWRRAVEIAAIPFLLISAASTALAQSIAATPDAVCPTCSIHLDSVAVLGKYQDPVSLHGSSKVVRSASGLFFVGPLFSAGRVAVYDGNGRFRAVFGREGEGPGELSAVDFLEPGAGDSVLVFGPGRTIVVSSESLEARDVRLPILARSAVAFSDGRFVVHAYDQRRELFGHPLHLVGSGGDVLLSFGNASMGATGGGVATRTRWLAPSATPGALWVARPNAYQIELWDTAGTRRMTIRRQPPWFTPWDSLVPGAPRQVRPPSQVIDVMEDVDHRLWILSYVADDEWTPASETAREARISPRAQDVTFDSILDVIDIETGDILASTILDAAAAGFIGPRMLYVHEEDDDGLVRIRVFTLHLESSGR